MQTNRGIIAITSICKQNMTLNVHCIQTKHDTVTITNVYKQNMAQLQ